MVLQKNSRKSDYRCPFYRKRSQYLPAGLYPLSDPFTSPTSLQLALVEQYIIEIRHISPQIPRQDRFRLHYKFFSSNSNFVNIHSTANLKLCTDRSLLGLFKNVFGSENRTCLGVVMACQSDRPLYSVWTSFFLNQL